MTKPEFPESIEILDILEDSRDLMFRICDESVPLFGSDRLHNLHSRCGDHLVMVNETIRRIKN